MKASSMKPKGLIHRSIVWMILPLLLLACKVDLYTGLNQREANQMLALLAKNGIEAERVFEKKSGLVTLTVEENVMAEAIEILRRHGLPRETFTNPSEIFKDDGLISSPIQENARYVYALSQDLAATISQLDGVLTARVHLVLLDKEARKRNTDQQKSGASVGVLIRYAKGADIQKFTPQIKMLIMNSIEGVTYDNISIAFFPGFSSEYADVNTDELSPSTDSSSGQNSKAVHDSKLPASGSTAVQPSLNSIANFEWSMLLKSKRGVVLFAGIILFVAAVGFWLFRKSRHAKHWAATLATMAKAKENPIAQRKKIAKPVADVNHHEPEESWLSPKNA